ncbi:F-box/LRR-repeat protein 2 isoform X2 [Drosophila grimshawi]|uniref:F-box/LRR-repeat protein 2 isoform X2 n=1 Tax=Drosophila grimshawi TaxID=7222 RepID=UPI001C935028|nr:F-box/LRR-repeat protein 2 isoform X2 [Drosophila grimshawi]
MSGNSGMVSQHPHQDSTSCPIMCLHEDIICQLFNYIPQLSDKVHLACVAPKFRDAFDNWARRQRSHSLNAQDVEQMQLPDLIVFFEVAGPFITVLMVNTASYHKESLIVEFIAEYCKNLEEIHFSNVTDEFRFGQLLSRLTHLRRVSIHCSDVEDVLNLDMESNQELEFFELINGCYTGKHLCDFPKLQTIVLRDCLLWNSGELGITLKKLRVLVLEGCCFDVMNQSLYEKIAKCCVDLEDLTFSNCDVHFEVIAQLVNLKRCTLKTYISTSNELNLDFLSALAEKRDSKLQYLNLTGQFEIGNEHATCLGQLNTLLQLHFSDNDVLEDSHFLLFNDLPQLKLLGLSWCGSVTDTGLANLICRCPQLNRMDINHCNQITNNLVFNAISCCGKGTGRSMILNVAHTKITNTMLEHPSYLNQKCYPQKHVKLNFTNRLD